METSSLSSERTCDEADNDFVLEASDRGVQRPEGRNMKVRAPWPSKPFTSPRDIYD